MPRLAISLAETLIETLSPADRDHDEPTTNYAILAALSRMEYSGRMTGHGFRSLAMGVIKERLGYSHDVVNRQLAHASGDVYGEAYDRAEFLDQRKVMMQEYADYLYAIEEGRKFETKSKQYNEG